MLPNTLTVENLTTMYQTVPSPFRVPIVLIPTDDVLALNTCDGDDLHRTFAQKLDEDYAIRRFLDSLRNEGFLLPVSLCNENYRHEGQWVIGNGNHRTATAIALGYNYIPFALVEGYTMDTFQYTDGGSVQANGLVLDSPIYTEEIGPDTYRSPWIDYLRRTGLVA